MLHRRVLISMLLAPVALAADVPGAAGRVEQAAARAPAPLAGQFRTMAAHA